MFARRRRAGATLLHCVSLDYPPLIQKDADSRVHGRAVDIVGTVLKINYGARFEAARAGLAIQEVSTTALRDQFDVELRAFVASGAYRRLLERYQIEITPELTRFLAPK